METTPPAEEIEPIVPEAGEDEPSGHEVLRRRLWMIVIALVVIIAVIPAFFSATPRACASCHYVKPFYTSWRADRHRAAAKSCLDCHLEPSLRGVVTYPFTFYGEVITALSGGLIKPPHSAAPSDRSCRQSGCHSLNRLQSLSRELRVNHRLHAEKAKVPCYKCHPGAGHDGADGRYMLPPMKMCAECHKDKMKDCKYCHDVRSLPNRTNSP